MPELPDVTVYAESILTNLGGQSLRGIRLFSPFVLRSVAPPVSDLLARRLESVSRIGKRIVLELEGELFIVIHLMIAGRFQLKNSEPLPKSPGKIGLASFDFETRSLILTEASQKKRASVHLVSGRAGLDAHRRGGIEPLEVELATFRAALSRERHTLKRALTDPDLVSGIGNAYSDEILHAARLSPFQLTTHLDDESWDRLFSATRLVLTAWTDRLRKEAGDFPTKVTAFRPEMAVHGKYRSPCPVCGSPVLRIVHGDNESNYCAGCQTGGRVLADRSLSRLLKEDWPRSLDDLEDRPALIKSRPRTRRKTGTKAT
ncbi:MAG: formamidopyrimidine-DNA glycosylase [Deltaproteobacteria bacterium]|nr:formamidopyrimidine-DNA glycosylase [Deltaproteobacteria bacterium]